jgi:site-specific DNA-methyltransferase (adenine-specific)
MIELDKVYFGDCLEIMPAHIPDKSIDLIFADNPFGTTRAKWDSVIPLLDFVTVNGKTYPEELFLLECYKKGMPFKEAKEFFRLNKRKGLWSEYERVIKDNGAILLFAQTPFTEILGSSNKKLLRYEWIWEKTQASGFYNAKKMPMKAHENLLVFYKKRPTYNPQKTEGHKPINTYTKRMDVVNKTEVYGKVKKDISGGGETDRYPRSVLKFASDKQKNKLNGTLHPTQKPLELIKYFIKTYSDEGDLFLDNTAGSSTLAVGCIELNRNYIGSEISKDYVYICLERINITLKNK